MAKVDMKFVLLTNRDDWGALYLFGNLLEEGHDYAFVPRMAELFLAASSRIQFKEFEVDFENYGFRAPEQLPGEFNV